MIFANNINTLRSQITTWRKTGEQIAFVPTMGNLHQGHAELVKQARKYAQRVVVSIFVNPLQFGPNEDYLAYPRTLEADQCLLEQLNTDLLFIPNVDTLYPNGKERQTKIEVPEISNILCGASRPGHFSGVATIVCKLFNLVQPDTAVFGEKDWQQLMIIRRMVMDLNLPITIIGVATIREADGVAMSSRNGYLTTAERQRAPALYQSLQLAAEQLNNGQAPHLVETEAKRYLLAAGLSPDYVSVRKKFDLTVATAKDQNLIILAAAYLGRARLIDNVQV
jgi:pantoate--beta-alanine ligase